MLKSTIVLRLRFFSGNDTLQPHIIIQLTSQIVPIWA
jgi:hypothetical protein